MKLKVQKWDMRCLQGAKMTFGKGFCAIGVLLRINEQAKFLVNKFDAELPIGTQKSILQFFNYLYISGLHI